MDIGSRVRHRERSWGTVLGYDDAGGVIVRQDGARVDSVWTMANIVCPADDERKYRVVRMYQNANVRHRTISRGLTLAEAQAHCADPETSSATATGSKAKARTKRYGAWFDGYDEGR